MAVKMLISVFWLWCHADLWVDTRVLVERDASILSFEDGGNVLI